MKVKLIDTMRDFLMYWRGYSGKSGEEMFGEWLTSYIANYPEILIAEVNYNRSLENLSKKMIEDVLPRLDQLIHEIIEAWMNFLGAFDEISSRAVEMLGIRLKPLVALYIGSGWKKTITTILDVPVLLFDLGGLAELGWISERAVRGLIAFTFGQLYHMQQRGGVTVLEKLEHDPFFRLYSEGLAQLSEHQILRRESWHGVEHEEAWLRDCRKMEEELAKQYLEKAEAGNVEAFYDPRREVLGIKLAGRYLGYQLMKNLTEEGIDLEKAAALPESEARKLSKEFLKGLVEKT